MGNHWVPKYDDDQREAITAAQLEHGYTAVAAVEAAARGELPGKWRSLKAFAMPRGTAADLAARRRREIRADQVATAEPSQALARHARRLTALLDKEIGKAEKKARRGNVEPQHLQALAKAGREIEALVNAARKVAEPKAPQSGSNDTTKRAPRSFMDRLAAEERRNGAEPDDAPLQAEDHREQQEDAGGAALTRASGN